MVNGVHGEVLFFLMVQSHWVGLLQTGLSRLVVHTGGGEGLLPTGLPRLVLFILCRERPDQFWWKSLDKR